jgi:hypothetical protein
MHCRLGFDGPCINTIDVYSSMPIFLLLFSPLLSAPINHGCSTKIVKTLKRLCCRHTHSYLLSTRADALTHTLIVAHWRTFACVHASVCARAKTRGISNPPPPLLPTVPSCSQFLVFQSSLFPVKLHFRRAEHGAHLLLTRCISIIFPSKQTHS